MRSVQRIRDRETQGKDCDITESEDSSNEARPTLETNLHTTSASQTPEDQTPMHIESDTGPRHQLSDEGREILQLAAPILAAVDQIPGDFGNHCYDTRTKERPTKKDILNISAVASELLKSGTPIDPFENPFGYLWLVDCILYSVAVAFYISKGWKNRRSTSGLNLTPEASTRISRRS